MTALVFLHMPGAYAQVESNFAAGGGVMIGWSATVCDASIAGAIRYNSGTGAATDTNRPVDARIG